MHVEKEKNGEKIRVTPDSFCTIHAHRWRPRRPPTHAPPCRGMGRAKKPQWRWRPLPPWSTAVPPLSADGTRGRGRAGAERIRSGFRIRITPTPLPAPRGFKSLLLADAGTTHSLFRGGGGGGGVVGETSVCRTSGTAEEVQRVEGRGHARTVGAARYPFIDAVHWVWMACTRKVTPSTECGRGVRTNRKPAEAKGSEGGGWGGWVGGREGFSTRAVAISYSHRKRWLPSAVHPWRVTPSGGGAPGWRVSTTTTLGRRPRQTEGQREQTKERKSAGDPATVYTSVPVRNAGSKRTRVPHAMPPQWIDRLHSR